MQGSSLAHEFVWLRWGMFVSVTHICAHSQAVLNYGARASFFQIVIALLRANHNDEYK